MIVLYVLIALIGAAVAVFALQNLDPVVIRFIGWRVEGLPLAVIILLALLAGLAFASLVGVIQQFKLRRQIRDLEARLRRAEADAAPPPGTELRTDPELR